MTGYSLKVKSRKGQHVVNNLHETTTIADLKTRISEITDIPAPFLHILIGFPPKPLDLSKDNEELNKSGITSGDTLIVEEKVNTLKADKESQRFANLRSDGEYVGKLLKKAVPGDNSCLFTSIGFVLHGEINKDFNTTLREIIAEEVSNDHNTYNEAFLGKPNREYCDWIKRPESWGGAIEVSILSSFHDLEIDVIDTTNGTIIRFGEDKNYRNRVFLVFNGVHYDPLYMEPITGTIPVSLFRTDEENVYLQAEEIAKETQLSRQSVEPSCVEAYVNRFTLRCMECNTMLTGQFLAQEHAVITGHMSFGEA